MASSAEERESVDPLDLLLTKKYGRSIIRNLITILMNGKITDTFKPTNPNEWAARSIAEEIVGGLKSVVRVVKPLKGDMKVALKVVQQSMAHLMDNLRAHFHLLSGRNCRNAGVPEESLPTVEDEDSDDDDGEDTCKQFGPEYL
ncbi:hypothetical protein BGZ65_012266, partial [Modicella reniformis]